MLDLQALIRRARETPNRGCVHVFMGDPRSDGCDKTTVEPGNAFSPGVWTCGVSVWMNPGSGWVTADDLSDDEIECTFIAEPGEAPVVESRYAVGPIRLRHRLWHLGEEGARGVDYSHLDVSASRACEAALAVVVRDVGPAGGRIESLDWDTASRTLTVNGAIRLVFEDAVERCVISPAGGDWDSPAAAALVRLRLDGGEGASLRFKAVHGFQDRAFSAELAECEPPAVLTVDEALGEATSHWREALPARVFAPDPRVALAWERCACHIQAAMECGLPRIGAVNYPIFWIRDCVIVLRALDLMGRHDLARIGNDYLAPLQFGGGFGAESDASGEGVWSLVRHAAMTRDDEWLERRFEQLRERVRWIERMLTATAPLRAMA